jgi:hypothetical protein
MPGQVSVGAVAVGIGTVIALLRYGARKTDERSAQMIADTRRREMEGRMFEGQRQAELLQRERDMTKARMHMALQQRGIYAYGDPTSAP